MRDPEQIYDLLVKENPVPDPESLPLQGWSPSNEAAPTLIDDRTLVAAAEVDNERALHRFRLLAVAASLVLVVGAGAMLFRYSSSQQPDANNERPPAPAAPPTGDSTVQSLDWVWDAEVDRQSLGIPPGYGSPDWASGQLPALPPGRGSLPGPDCYGSGSPSPTGREIQVDLPVGRVSIVIGLSATPTVALSTDLGVTDVGNPFGEDAWVCSVSASETTALAVGSAVWWTNDGVVWHQVEAFDALGGINPDGSNLVWAGAGQLGYVALGRTSPDGLDRVGWHSNDLETWHEIPLDGPPYPTWGWFGPDFIDITEEQIIILMQDGGFIGRPVEESGS